MRAVPSPVLVLAGHERLARRIDEDDEGPGFREVGREARGDRQRRVLELDLLERPDPEVRVAEAALQVRPEEGQEAAQHLRQPESDPATQRNAQEAPRRDIPWTGWFRRLLMASFVSAWDLSMGSTW